MKHLEYEIFEKLENATTKIAQKYGMTERMTDLLKHLDSLLMTLMQMNTLKCG